VHPIGSQNSGPNDSRPARAGSNAGGHIATRRASKNAGKPLAAVAVAAAFGLAGAALSTAEAQTLGTAEEFGVLGSSTVTNTGPSVIFGSVGVSPGSASVGFPPGLVIAPGTFHAADAVAAQARADAITAYTNLQGLAPDFDLSGQNLGGLTLAPAVYSFTSSAQLTGVLTLNGLGNPNAEFVFQIGSTLTTASNSAVLLINGANGDNVYWAVGSSATLGTNTRFTGNIVALTSITLNTGASIVCGRALAQNGAVTLDNNTITLCIGGVIPPEGDVDITTGELFGEGVTGFQLASFGALGLFGSAMMGQGAFWRDGAPQDFYGITPQSLKDTQAGSLKDDLAGWEGTMPGDDPRRSWRLWTVGYGGTGSFDGDPFLGTSDLDTRTVGFAVGLDYQVDPTTLVGIAGGYSNSRFSVDELDTSGSSEGGHVGIYGVKTFGRAYLAASADYAHFENETDRLIDWLIDEQADGEFSSDGYSARFEVGYKQPVDRFNVTPFAGLAVSHLDSDGFTEDSVRIGGGPGGLGLTYNGISQDSVTSSLGIQLDTRLELEEGRVLLPFARVAWVHEFESDRSIDGFLTASPDFTFTSFGASAAEDLAKVNAGFSLDMTGGIGVFAYFDGEFSDHSQSYTGNGGIKIAW
jgi:outer membrane autotransporter protein